MKILAGIDEAGLGPTIGPLVTASAAIAVPDDWLPDSPWEALSDAFCRSWRKGEKRAGVADSKVLYRNGGLAVLERTVAAFSRLAGQNDGFDFTMTGLDGKKAERLHPCYSGKVFPFPAHCAGVDIDAAVSLMEKSMRKAGVDAVHLAAAALYEPLLNRRFLSGLNKNEALLVETGGHLVALVEKFRDCPLTVVADKQGGRNDYLPFLTDLFPGKWFETLEAGRERSVYRMRRRGGRVEIHFAAKGDRDSFVTALASLAAKYVRERAMEELNSWFGKVAPGVRPTAGYPLDAARWLAEVEKCCGSGVGMEMLIRQR